MKEKHQPTASGHGPFRQEEFTLLPGSWVLSSVGQLYKIVGGGTPSTKVEEYWTGNIPWISSADIHGVKDIRPRKKINNNAIKNSATNLVPKGTILVVTRVGLGKVALTETHLCFSQDTQALTISDSLLDPKYSLYYLSRAVQTFKSNNRGTTISGVTKLQLSNLSFPLPPLHEQHRIVAKIEELFSSLNKGIENLKTVQKQLKVYRQAVLKWAFRGNWDVREFGLVAEIKRGKSKHRPRDAKELFGGPYPFIQTGEVRAANGGIINAYSQTYSEIGLMQSKLWPKGTLCLTIAANIAETAFLGFDACFPDSVVGIKTEENNLSIKFVNYYIQKLKQKIDSKASATAQKNINVEFLERLPIPIPPIEKQNAIVAEIESRLSVCDKIEESIEQSLKQAESLRQSILKKAFEGKLVPQDPNDEPASVLLERIRRERAETPSSRLKKGAPK